MEEDRLENVLTEHDDGYLVTGGRVLHQLEAKELREQHLDTIAHVEERIEAVRKNPQSKPFIIKGVPEGTVGEHRIAAYHALEHEKTIRNLMERPADAKKVRCICLNSGLDIVTPLLLTNASRIVVYQSEVPYVQWADKTGALKKMLREDQMGVYLYGMAWELTKRLSIVGGRNMDVTVVPRDKYIKLTFQWRKRARTVIFYMDATPDQRESLGTADVIYACDTNLPMDRQSFCNKVKKAFREAGAIHPLVLTTHQIFHPRIEEACLLPVDDLWSETPGLRIVYVHTWKKTLA